MADNINQGGRANEAWRALNLTAAPPTDRSVHGSRRVRVVGSSGTSGASARSAADTARSQPARSLQELRDKRRRKMQPPAAAPSGGWGSAARNRRGGSITSALSWNPKSYRANPSTGALETVRAESKQAAAERRTRELNDSMRAGALVAVPEGQRRRNFRRQCSEFSSFMDTCVSQNINLSSQGHQ